VNPNRHIPSRYIALLVKLLESEGVDCAPALREAGIDRASLRHTDAQLPAERILAATRSLMAAGGGRADLPLKVGAMIGHGQLGELGRAMLSCATVRDSLALCARYHELVTPTFSMRTREVGDVYELRWQPVQAVPYDLMRAAFDVMLMSFHTRIKSVLHDKVPAYDAYLTTPAPADMRAYAAMRPGRCHFGQEGLPSLRITIDAQILARTPMPLANPADLAEAEERLRPRLHSMPVYRDWRTWVEMMLKEVQGHQPSQEELAALVGVSSSTLARNLAAQGTSFRTLANAIRHQRACAWLASGHLKVADIARLLGYTDAANFIRAFKSQAGVSPAQYAALGAAPTTAQSTS
jgi:AraC-like DNA-binding protein